MSLSTVRDADMAAKRAKAELLLEMSAHFSLNREQRRLVEHWFPLVNYTVPRPPTSPFPQPTWGTTGILCYWCDRPIPIGKLHRDHVIPKAKGGGNSPDNLVDSCESCNCSKGAKFPWDWRPHLRSKWVAFYDAWVGT